MPVLEAARINRNPVIEPGTAIRPARSRARFDPGPLDEEPPYGRHARGVVRTGRPRRLILVAAAALALGSGVPLVFGMTGDGPRAYPRAQLPQGGPRIQDGDGPAAAATSIVAPPASAAPSPAGTPGPATYGRGPAGVGAGATPAAGTAPPAAASNLPVARPNPTPGEPVAGEAPTDISIEAEAPSVVRGGRVGTRTVASASGGTVVTGIGGDPANTVRFSAITVPAAGHYAVTFHYVSGGELRDAAISVNGRGATTVAFPATADWDTVGKVSVRLRLAAGPNTVEVGNASGPAPDLDRIVITSQPPREA